MLKIVVFDSGYGGELLADRLEKEFPLAKIIRVIDWRHAEQVLKGPLSARRVAREALRPYIGQADLIVLANFLLTITSLKYFKRKYRHQRFVGLGLTHPGTFKRESLIITTKAVTRTIGYYNYLRQLRRRTDTIYLDNWVELIDDGELPESVIARELNNFFNRKGHLPDEIILACGQFSDIKPEIRRLTRYNVKIHDGFDDVVTAVGKNLKIRGAATRKRKSSRVPSRRLAAPASR